MKREPRRPLGRLVAIAFGIIAIWLVIALFNTSEFYLRSAATYNLSEWHHVLLYQLSVALNWAYFTPPIVFFAERIRFRKPRTRRDVLMLLGTVLMVVLFIVGVAWIRSVWGAIVLKLSERDEVTREFIIYCLQIRFHRNVFIVATIIGVVRLVMAYRKAAAGEREAFALQAELANAELAHLRLRLQPRFMAAALQEIRSRVRVSPDEADALLVRVSRLLRRSVDFDRSGEVTLREELDFVDQYLGVENLRLHGKLSSVIHAGEDELLAARVPPLLLQTIVASVVMQSPRGGHLEIVARRRNGLALEVRATRGAGAVDADTLAEARVRLEQIFSRNEAITTRRIADGWITTITLPLRMGEEAAA